jgi:integrase
MANYLIRRNGRYSYRRRYPTEVAALILKSEFVQALGTADPKEAARLSRVVSVRFDSECEEALRSHQEVAAMPSAPLPPDAQPTDENVATGVLASLPGVIRTMTHAVIAEQSRNKAGWQDALSWRRRGLAAHVAGEMPAEIQMHPLVAATALRAFDAASAGAPLPFPPVAEDYIPTRGVGHASVPSDEGRLLTSDMLEKAIVEYSIDKSSRRQQVARRCVARSLKLPCTKIEAARQIADWCVAALGTDKKTSSVWTEASAVIALLKFVPTWHDFRVEKVGELRKLRGAGRANVTARASMQVSTLYSVLNTLPQNLPRDGDHWYAALLICALYGMRPGELLQSGPEALQSRRDVFGNERLVFKVGMRGAKNRASERDLPVSEELRPIFEHALRRGSCMVRKSQSSDEDRVPLYSVRHLFADIARACNYPDAAFGPIMGHSDRGITAVYGGKAPLDHHAEILRAVQDKLFPKGLGAVWPISVKSDANPHQNFLISCEPVSE